MAVLQQIYKLRQVCRGCESSCYGCSIKEQLDELYDEYDAEVKAKTKGGE